MYKLPYITLQAQNNEIIRYLRELVTELNVTLDILNKDLQSATKSTNNEKAADTIVGFSYENGWRIIKYSSGRVDLYKALEDVEQTFSQSSGYWYINDLEVSLNGVITLRDFWFGYATHCTGDLLCKVLWDNTNNSIIIRTVTDSNTAISDATIYLHITGTWK